MKEWLVVFTASALVLAIASGSYWLGVARAPRPPARVGSTERARSPSHSENDDKLATVIAGLDRRLAMLELRERIAVAAAPSADAIVGRQNDHEEPPDIQAIMEAQHEIESDAEATISARLTTESRDRTWASAAEEQLQSGVKAAAREGAEFSISTTKCLTSICEMVLSAARPDQLQDSVFQLGNRFSGMAGFTVGRPEQAADGSSRVTYRFFREGHPPPSP